MPKSFRIWLPFILITPLAYYYYYYYHYYSISSLLPKPTTVSTLVNVTLEPPQYKIIEMNDRSPSFKLATIDGKKPYADGDRAQATVIDSLQLAKQCNQDPSLIVVDVGGFVGDFGLYAAACNCQVYIFETQPVMVDLIRASIELNNFSTSRVHIIPKAVNDLPSNSQLSFASDGSLSRAISGGTFNVSTIRLDDVEWPSKSSILMLKVDVEGFELNVLRSAENLFRQKRIHHLICEYTAWWTDRAPQKDLIPFVENNLQAKQLYALHRIETTIYGPLTRKDLDEFYENHATRHLQTDIYAIFIEFSSSNILKLQPYNLGSSFA